MAKCRSCAQPVVWAVTRNGNRMPFNKRPRGDGHYLFEFGNPGTPPLALYQSPEQIAALQQAALATGKPWHGLMVPHAATCPERDGWRKQKRRKAAA